MTALHRAFNGAPSKALKRLYSVLCLLIPDTHFALNVILARDRSYGVSSTVTLSPGSILM